MTAEYVCQCVSLSQYICMFPCVFHGSVYLCVCWLAYKCICVYIWWCRGDLFCSYMHFFVTMFHPPPPPQPCALCMSLNLGVFLALGISPGLPW